MPERHIGTREALVILDLAMLLTSDPHAWLRPYFAVLAQDDTFARLAPSIQFSALRDAVAQEHPTKAAQMREWPPAAQVETLRWLANVIQERPPVSEVEFMDREEGRARASLCRALLADWP